MATTFHSKEREEFEKRLIEDNILLAAAQAHSFPTSGFDVQDLLQIGSIGLIKAARSFNPDLGFKFSTLATICIRREIIRELKKDQAHKKPEELSIDIEKIEGDDFWELVPDSLNTKEREILKLRLIDGLTFREIGEKMDCTKAWASSQYKSIIDKVREANLVEKT